jgi:hypothetical protein
MLSSNPGHNVEALDAAKFRAWAAYMNTSSHPNEQLYAATQAWNASPWLDGLGSIDDPTLPTHFTDFQLAAFSDSDKAMTNGELWTTYGRTVGGYAAPADAVALPGSNVLVAERQSLIPNWSFRFAPRLTNNPSGYVLKITDEKGAAVSFPPVNLHEGWNFIPEDHDGFHYSMMVFCDTQPPVLTLDPKQVLSVTVAELSLPFTLHWTVQDNSWIPTPSSVQSKFTNLLGFTLQTRSDGTQLIVIPIKMSDRAGNVTELDRAITVTPDLELPILGV